MSVRMVIQAFALMILVGCGSSGGPLENNIPDLPMSTSPGLGPQDALRISHPEVVVEGEMIVITASITGNQLSSINWTVLESNLFSPREIETRFGRWQAISPSVIDPTNLQIQVDAVDRNGATYQKIVTVKVLDNPEANRQPPLPTISQPSTLIAGETATVTVDFEIAANQSLRSIQWRSSQANNRPIEIVSETDDQTLEFIVPQTRDGESVTLLATITDSADQAASANITFTPQNNSTNQLPQVEIIAPFMVSAGSTVMLDACQSFDQETAQQDIQFRWFKAGAEGEILGQQCTLNLETDQPGGYQEALTVAVTDSDAGSTQVTHELFVAVRPSNERPTLVSSKAIPTPAYPGERVRLRADSRDVDGDRVKYQWLTDDQNLVIEQANSADAVLILPPDAMPESRYQVTVKVFDDLTELGNENESRVDISVARAPVSSAPTLIECAANPLQLGCAGAGISRLPDTDFYLSCSDPTSEACVLSQLAASGVNLSECFTNAGQCNLSELIRQEPTSNTLYSLSQQQSAGQCNPVAPAEVVHLIGTLHEHTAYSDGAIGTTPEQVMAQVSDRGFDFTIVTDHSDSLLLPIALCTSPEDLENGIDCVLADPDNPQNSFTKWDATQAAAERQSDNDFSAIRGFEWTSDRFGHINVLDSSNNLNAKTELGYAVSMDVFWQWFLYPADLGGGSDGLLSFNHPGREDTIHEIAQNLSFLDGNPDSIEDDPRGDPAFTFNNFRYVRGADYRTVAVEVFGKGSLYDPFGLNGSWLGTALDQGWYLAPTGSEDHHSKDWGGPGLPKTVVIARNNTPADIREALLARRVYATRQNFNDVKVDMQLVDGVQSYPMGSRLHTSSETLRIDFDISRQIGALENVQVELITSLNNTVYEDLKAEGDKGRYTPIMTAFGPQGSFTIDNQGESLWYFLRVKARSESEQDHIIAYTAPVWIKQSDTGALGPCPTL